MTEKGTESISQKTYILKLDRSNIITSSDTLNQDVVGYKFCQSTFSYTTTYEVLKK